MKQELRALKLNDDTVNITFQLIPRDRKHIGIKVVNGETVVLLWPKRFSTKEWEQAISSKKIWIERQLLKVRERENHARVSEIAIHEGIWVLGKPVMVPLPEEWVPSQKEQALLSLFHIVGEAYLRKRFDEICRNSPHLTHRGAPKLNLRSASSRWGSCNSKGHIMLNRRLFAAPVWVIDYVIYHELCHLKYMAHDANFWSLLESQYLDVGKAKEWLKQHQLILMAIDV